MSSAESWVAIAFMSAAGLVALCAFRVPSLNAFSCASM